MSDANLFRDTIEDALKHYLNTEWLGTSSPLSSAYLLGHHLADAGLSGAMSAQARGRVLQRLLSDATNRIDGKYADRYKMILREYYFHDRSVEVVCDMVGLGRNSFHLGRNAAIDALCEILLNQLNPSLRLETPPDAPVLVERTLQIQECIQALEANKMVCLTGGGGLGKTSLGSYLTTKLQRPVFWSTIRNGLNDHLDAFLFSLGYFLHSCGSSALWLELVSHSGSTKLERVLGVTRYALEQLRPITPLLCVDEFDLLHPHSDGAHAAVTQFVETLRGLTPILLIGQQPVIDAHLFVTLKGLSHKATKQYLEERLTGVSSQQIDEIYQRTQGSPRLLELFVAIVHSGESIETLLQEARSELTEHPSLEFLLERMLRRMNEVERCILLELSVYRRPAPLYTWQKGAGHKALSRLVERSLVQTDQNAGVALLPAYRQIIYQSMPDETRKICHRLAATVRATSGDIAASAYHLIQAGEIDHAVWLCYENRQQLINQGQAQTVLFLLEGVRHRSMTALAQETLLLLGAEFRRLVGDTTKAVADLHAIVRSTPILSIDADLLAGQMANDESNFIDAEKSFQRGLTVAEKLVETRLVNLHRGLAWRHFREREIEQALQQVELARYEVENLQGELQNERYNYSAAESHYLAALEIAKQNKHVAGVAKSSMSLALQYIFQGRTEDALAYLKEAEALYRQLGMYVMRASIQLNFALAHNMAGEYQHSLDVAQKALTELSRFGAVPPWQQAIAYQVISEANLGIGNLDEAAHYAQQLMATEEVELVADAYRMMGEILHRRGNDREAARLVRTALEHAKEMSDPHMEAYAWRSLGIVSRESNPQQSADAFSQAMALFNEMKLVNEVKKTEAQQAIASVAR